MDMRIQSIRKSDPLHSERTVSVENTLARATRAMVAAGVTRLADVTGLDRVGISVYSAMVPKSDDVISVYNGKGVRPIDAKTGALMEAIERQTALNARLPVIEARFRNLRRGRAAVADPRTFNHKLRSGYDQDRPCLWIQGYDLIANEPVLVPAVLAGYGAKYLGAKSPFAVNSSNGLAAGNCFEEAVCHALCELLERDAWSLAELRSQWIPWARREVVFGPNAGAAGWDDVDAYPRIDLEGVGSPISELLAKFKRAGLCPVVRDITSDLGVCSAMASVADESVPGFPQVHSGMGTHPNARIAVVRALCELAQSRAVDIQGAREDLIASNGKATAATRHMRRVERIEWQRWCLQQAGRLRPLRDMPSVVNDDIADDIRLILSRLARHGMQRAIVVDFSEPGRFSVVRVMVPGLEFWSLDQGKIGPRALQFWKQHA